MKGLRTALRDEITRSNLYYRVGPNVIIEDEEEIERKDEEQRPENEVERLRPEIRIPDCYFQPIVSILFTVHRELWLGGVEKSVSSRVEF